MDFFDYVLGFYGRGGAYEMDPPATRREVIQATKARRQPPYTDMVQWGGGDSTDREVVRDIILRSRGAAEEDLEYPINKE